MGRCFGLRGARTVVNHLGKGQPMMWEWMDMNDWPFETESFRIAIFSAWCLFEAKLHLGSVPAPCHAMRAGLGHATGLGQRNKGRRKRAIAKWGWLDIVDALETSRQHWTTCQYGAPSHGFMRWLGVGLKPHSWRSEVHPRCCGSVEGWESLCLGWNQNVCFFFERRFSKNAYRHITYLFNGSDFWNANESPP